MSSSAVAVLRVVEAVGAVGVRRERQGGQLGPNGAQRLEVVPRADLQLHPAIAGSGRLGGTRDDLGRRGDPDRRSRGHAPVRRAEERGEGAPLGAQPRVEQRHLHCCLGHPLAADRPQPLETLDGRAALFEGPAGEEARHQVVGEDPGRPVGVLLCVDRLGERLALAVALARVGDHPDEDERPHGVLAGARRQRDGERELEADQLDGVQLHGPAALPSGARRRRCRREQHARPRDGHAPPPRVVCGCAGAPARAHPGARARHRRPGWRNGRRGGLKSRCPKGRAGSSPAPGTGNGGSRPAAGDARPGPADRAPPADRPAALADRARRKVDAPDGTSTPLTAAQPDPRAVR